MTTNTMIRSLTAIIVTITIAITITVPIADGQVGTCVEKLTNCFSYLNGTTTPPANCCTPLKDAVTNQKQCLCNLYQNPELLKGLHVNMTQALDLPTRCNIPTKTAPADFCKGVAPSGSPSTPSSTPPTGGKGSGSAATITGTGFIFGLLMFVTYVFVY